MKKTGAIITVVVLEIIVYLFLLVVIPFVADTVLSVNTTLNASSNMSNYPGTSGFLLSTPLILFFVPGVIGIALVIMILRRQD